MSGNTPSRRRARLLALGAACVGAAALPAAAQASAGPSATLRIAVPAVIVAHNPPGDRPGGRGEHNPPGFLLADVLRLLYPPDTYVVVLPPDPSGR